MSTLVPVKTFANRPEAELARGMLEAAGIHAAVTADDAGGMRPELAFSRGVRLLVAVDEVERASTLLAAEEPPERAAERRVLGARLRGCMLPGVLGVVLVGVGMAISDGVRWVGAVVVLAGIVLLVVAIVRGTRAA